MDETVLPPELKEANRQTWLQMIVVAAGLVFVLDLVANFISFSTRFVSALGTAVLFAVLFGAAPCVGKLTAQPLWMTEQRAEREGDCGNDVGHGDRC